MKQDTVDRHYEKVCKVLRHITQNLEEPHSLRDLSRIACFAPYHFHRIFREVTGEPLQRYIRQLKLDLAAYHLLSTERPIIDVALEAGYQSHEAFTRAFQQTFRMTPSRFRAHAARLRQGWACLPEEGAVDAAAPQRQGLVLEQRTWGGCEVVFQSHFGPCAEIPRCWQGLAQKLRARGVDPGEVTPIGIMHDDPLLCSSIDIRYDACGILPARCRQLRMNGTQILPRIESVSAVHRGLHALVPLTYVRLINTLAALGHERGLQLLPYYELYAVYPFLGAADEVRAEIHVSMI